ELPIQTRRAVDRHVHRQRHECERPNCQGHQADERKDDVPALVPGDELAYLLECLLVHPGASGFDLIHLAEPAGHEVTHDVEYEHKDHQREPCGEDGLVADTAVRQITQGHLHDK